MCQGKGKGKGKGWYIKVVKNIFYEECYENIPGE